MKVSKLFLMKSIVNERERELQEGKDCMSEDGEDKSSSIIVLLL